MMIIDPGTPELTDLLMPRLGLTMTEGTITEWLKKTGDRIERDEVIFHYETEKSSLEFEAPTAGYLAEIRVETGQTVPCYTVCGVIAASLSEPERMRATAPTMPVIAVNPIVSNLPAGRTFRASPRAKKAARDLEIDLQTVIGTGELGRITEADVNAAYDASILDPVLAPERREPATIPTMISAVTPVARRVAAETQIDLTGVNGSGKNGKVTKSDVLNHTAPPAATISESTPEPVPTDRADLSDPTATIKPFTAIRTITARRMTESAREAPQVTLTTEADAVALIGTRERLNAASHELKISNNALFIAICAVALREHPDLNATYTDKGLRLNAQITIGIAVDSEKGLLVPVIPDVGSLKLAAIQRELDNRIARARAGKAPPTDFEGGTFTISNLGMFDIDTFTPIVNLPQTAILGVGRIVPRVVPWGGVPAIREQVALSLSFDHRVVDGGPAARFLKRVKDLIENPLGLLL